MLNTTRTSSSSTSPLTNAVLASMRPHGPTTVRPDGLALDRTIMESTTYYVPPYLRQKSNVSETGLTPILCDSGIGRVSPTQQTNTWDDLLGGKACIIRKCIHQIEEEIEEREALYKRTVASLDRQYLELKEALIQTAPYGSSTVTIGDSRRRSSIEKELSTLESERRREQISVWKDISQLKAELRLLNRELLEEEQREKVMVE